MGDRCICAVAVHALRNPVVAKRDRLPFGRGVAGGAGVAGVMRGGCLRRMTRGTIDETRMVEPCLFPGHGVVTVGALPGVVIGGGILLLVTIGAVVETEVIKGYFVPVRGVVVTTRAGVGVGFRYMRVRGCGHCFEGLNAYCRQVFDA